MPNKKDKEIIKVIYNKVCAELEEIGYKKGFEAGRKQALLSQREQITKEVEKLKDDSGFGTPFNQVIDKVLKILKTK